MNGDNSSPEGLAALESRLARGLAQLNYPPVNWVPEKVGRDGRIAADVLIVGAGMNGLCAAFALRRLGVANIRQIDMQPKGQEGPWLNYARMEYLRSPKHLAGPALGLPDLTFQAWWQAQYGQSGWDALGYIERRDWARYLTWFARVTGATVQSETSLTGLRYEDGLITASAANGGNEAQIFARQVVLATGREGQAKPRIPIPFAPHLGAGVQHSSAPLDRAGLAGSRIVVVGLSASAFDNACLAAEAGSDVTLLGRAPHLPTVNKMKQTVYPGFAHGFPNLPGTDRLAWLRMVAAARVAPPRHTVQRAARAGVKVELGVETDEVVRADGALKLITSKGVFTADRVILGTGFRFDFAGVSELSGFASRTLLWRDLAVAEGPEDELLDCPVVGPGFELRPKPGHSAAGFNRIRCFSHAAQPSLGNLANDIPQASEGADRLARAIACDLFIEDADYHRRQLEAYSEPELLGDEYP